MKAKYRVVVLGFLKNLNTEKEGCDCGYSSPRTLNSC